MLKTVPTDLEYYLRGHQNATRTTQIIEAHFAPRTPQQLIILPEHGGAVLDEKQNLIIWKYVYIRGGTCLPLG